MLCFVLSPLLIAFFVLPQTAGATKALYRTLLEVASWKIIWSLMAALLWKSTLTQLNSTATSDPNFITTVAYMIMLALSVIATPLVVKAFIGPGLSGIAGMAMTGAAAISSAGLLTPTGIKTMGSKVTRGGARLAGNGVHHLGQKAAKGFQNLKQNKPKSSRGPNEPKWVKQMNKEVPPPHQPPGWMESKLKKEKANKYQVEPLRKKDK